jgi:two-component system phosphate regulon sensor histidine kinase PhoR
MILDEISRLERGEQLLYKQNFIIQELILEVFDALSIKTQEKNIHASIKKVVKHRSLFSLIKKK